MNRILLIVLFIVLPALFGKWGGGEVVAQTLRKALNDSLPLQQGKVKPVVVHDSIDELAIANYIEVIADTSGLWTIEDVSSSDFKWKFQSIEEINKDSTLESDVYWLRFSIDRSYSNKEFLVILGGDTSILFIQDTLGHFDRRITGNMVHFKDRDFQMRNFIHLHLPSHKRIQTYYAKLVFDKPARFNKGIEYSIIMSSNEKILSDELEYRFISALFVGVFLALAFYNLTLFFSLKEISYLYYVLYILSFAFSWMIGSGYAFELLWPNHPTIDFAYVMIPMFSFMFWYVLFGKTYLRTRTHHRKWNTVLNIYLIGSIVIPIILWIFFSGDGSELPAFLSAIIVIVGIIWPVLTFFIVIIPAIVSWRSGYTPARYFLLANLLLTLGFIVSFVILIVGIIGGVYSGTNGNYSVYAVQTGASLEVIVFSLGLGNRFNLLQKEKELAQQKTIEQLEENQLLQTKVNRELEQKVQERTIEVVQQKEKVEAKNHAIIESITYARKLQEAVLPPPKVVKEFFHDSFLLYLPRDIVSGDFYWMESKDGVSLFALGDCTGHGVPGAMLSVMGLNGLNRALNELHITQPADFLTQLTKDLHDAFQRSDSMVRDGMDLSICALDSTNRKLTYAGANNPLWIARNGEIIVHKPNKRPVGHHDIEGEGFSQVTIDLQAGDTIYLMTDGYADQLGGPNGLKMMTKVFRERLAQLSTLPLPQQREQLIADLDVWKGSGSQTDDVCVMGVRV